MAAGDYLQLALGPFLRIGADGTTTELAPTCATFTAADADPSGIMLAVSPGESNVREVDPVSGRCRVRFTTPVPMKAIAVAPDGTVYTVSAEKIFGQDVLYTFAADGKLVVERGIQVAGAGSAVAGLRTVEGMDFYNGKLYAIDHGSLYGTYPIVYQNKTRIAAIDPATAFGLLAIQTLVAPELEAAGDIDIDATGTLRTVSGGKLLSYKMTYDQLNLVLTEPTTLQLDRPTGTGGAFAHR
jgi:hypothetical protein